MSSPIFPSPLNPAQRHKGALAPMIFLFALWAAHTALVVGYGHVRPERMNIRGPDPVAYYSYFHSLYFDHDLEFDNQYELLGQGFSRGARTATGKTENHSSVGPAIALAPFWIGGDIVARRGGWPADGTSRPYHMAGFIGLAFYGLIALWLLGFWGMRHFGRWAGTFAAALAWFVSPMLHYCYPETLMPHALGAAASTLFLFAAERAQPSSRRSALLMGGALGLAMLMRWQNFLFVLYPGVLSAARLVAAKRVRLTMTHQAQRELAFWALAAVAAIIVFSPQMAAWQVLFGRPFTAPQGGKYFFPWRIEALRVLFSTHNGLFVWTPGVAFGVVGLFFAPERLRVHALGLGAALLAQLYLNSTVLDWHGAWAFSSRRFTESAAVFAFGFGALLTLQAGRRWRRGTALAGLAFVAWNELMVFQYVMHLVSWSEPLTFHELVTDKFHLGYSYRRRLMIDAAWKMADGGDIPGALALLESSIPMDPRHDDICEAMGQMCEQAGQYSLAIEYFRRGLIRRPGNPRLLDHIARNQAHLARQMGLAPASASSSRQE